MPIFTVTPGKIFGANEALTIFNLNLLGAPTVEPTSELYEVYSTFKNGFLNGSLQLWQRGTSAKSCPAATKTWRADRWFVLAAGAAVTCERSAVVPTGAVAPYAAKLVGAAAATTVDFAQRIEAIEVATNFRSTRTFSAYIYNATGANFTPTLRVKRPTVADVYTQSTSDSFTLQACPAGTWTQVSVTLDPSLLSDYLKGLEFAIRIPSGSMDDATKSVLITQLQVEPGSAVTAQESRLIALELLLCQRYLLALTGQFIGYADAVGTLGSRGLFPYPTPLRAIPVFEGTIGALGTADNFYETAGGLNPGTPRLTSAASALAAAVDNSEVNWTVTASIYLTALLSAEITT